MKKVLISFSILVLLLVGVIWYISFAVPLIPQELTILATDYLNAFNNNSSFETDIYLFDFEKDVISVPHFHASLNNEYIEWRKVQYFTEHFVYDIPDDLNSSEYANYYKTEKVNNEVCISSDALTSLPIDVVDVYDGLYYSLNGWKDVLFDNILIEEGFFNVFENKFTVPFYASDSTIKGEVVIYLNSFKRIIKVEMIY